MIHRAAASLALLFVAGGALGCAAPEPKCPPAPSAAPVPPPAAPAAPATPPTRDPGSIQLEPYALVILRRGPAWTPESTPATEALQKEHLGHLRRMAEMGKLVVAGPFDDQPDPTMRGLCLYRTSLAEARSLAESDPAVKAGRLRVEVMTWYTEKGALAFPVAAEMARPK